MGFSRLFTGVIPVLITVLLGAFGFKVLLKWIFRKVYS